MNANTQIDLDVLHAAIVQDIKNQFPDLRTVEFYRGEGNDHDDRKTLPTPGCLLNLSEFEPADDDDPMTGQLAVIAHFEANILIRFTEQNAKRNIRKLAAAFSAWIRNRRWTNPSNAQQKLPTGPAMFAGAYPDDFSSINSGREKQLDQYEIWKIEWRQTLHLGEFTWKDEGTSPTNVYLGQSPLLGNDHSDDYEQVAP